MDGHCRHRGADHGHRRQCTDRDFAPTDDRCDHDFETAAIESLRADHLGVFGNLVRLLFETVISCCCRHFRRA
jgi:hypothetical protein